MKKLSIEEISKDHAVVSMTLDGEWCYFHLTLSEHAEFVETDNFYHPISYTVHSAVVDDVVGLDDDGEPFVIGEILTEYVKYLADCGELHEAYDGLFESDYKVDYRVSVLDAYI